jgi:HK97 family phage prohead protease
MTHVRALATEWELEDEGRTVTGQIVPFGEVAHVIEMVDGERQEYDEEFLPGCTLRMRQTARARGGQPAWIRFTIDHEQAFDSRLGYCTSLTESPKGARGTFRLYDGPQLPKVRSMLTESHNGLSIEFSDIAPPSKTEGGVVQRRQINLAAVTATPIPVYAGAKILAVREVDDILEAVGTPNIAEVRAMLAALVPAE